MFFVDAGRAKPLLQMVCQESKAVGLDSRHINKSRARRFLFSLSFIRYFLIFLSLSLSLSNFLSRAKMLISKAGIPYCDIIKDEHFLLGYYIWRTFPDMILHKVVITYRDIIQDGHFLLWYYARRVFPAIYERGTFPAEILYKRAYPAMIYKPSIFSYDIIQGGRFLLLYYTKRAFEM